MRKPPLSALPSLLLTLLLSGGIGGGMLTLTRVATLAHLSDDPLCRASYRLPREYGPDARVCIPRENWDRWLRSRAPAPPPLPSLSTRGRWHVFSPLENAPGPENSLAVRKELLRTFRPDDWPGPETVPESRTLAAIQSVEWARDRLSHALAPFDPDGILRKIALSEATKETDPGLDGELGLVGLATAGGIHLYALARLIDYCGSRLLGGVARASGGAFSVELGLVTVRALSTAAWGWAFLLSGARAGMLFPWFLLALRQGAYWLGLRWREGFPLLIGFAAFAVLDFAYQGSSSGMIFRALALLGVFLAFRGSLFWSASLGAWALPAFWSAGQTGMISLASPVFNLLLILLVAGLAYPAVFVLSLLPTRLLVPAIHALSPLWQLCHFTVHGMEWLVFHSFLVWVVTKKALFLGAWGSFVVLSLHFFLSRKKSETDEKATPLIFLALLGAVAILGTAWSFPGHSDHSNPVTQVEQLDVGQGDAALIQVHGGQTGLGTGLIDTGSQSALRPSDWLTLFSARGITRIDWIALTHLDEDHAGGSRTLAELMPIGCVETSRDELESDRGRDLTVALESHGILVSEWGSGCIPFPVFAPPEGETGRNMSMGAILIPLPLDASGSGAYLSMGDAEGENELEIARRITRSKGQELHPLVLKISHHGSAGSSSSEVLDLLKPEVAIISDGIGNTYGHPADITLTRLGERHVPVFRTDELGSIDVRKALSQDSRR
jgi:competence protein ComEC